MFRIFICLLLCSFTSYGYHGADGILEQLDETIKKGKEEPSAATGFTKRVEKLTKQRNEMQPGEAVKAWLNLHDEFVAQLRQQPAQAHGLLAVNIFQAIPGPEAWPILREAIDNRTIAGKDATLNHALRLFGHTLTGDRGAQDKDLAALRAIAKKKKNDELRKVVKRIQQANRPKDDEADLIANFKKRMRRGAWQHGASIEVPDLVTLAGQKDAKPLLQELLAGDKMLTVPVGDDTRLLAQQLALSLVETLKTPQWELAHSLSTTELFEALDKRFPLPANEEEEEEESHSGDDEWSAQQREASRATAAGYYILGLIAKNRTTDAHAAMQRFTEALSEFKLPIMKALPQLHKAGFKREVYAFVKELVDRDPTLDLWPQVIRLAAPIAKHQEVIDTLNATLTNAELTPAQTFTLRTHLVSALLAADQVKPAVEQLLALVTNNDDEVERGSVLENAVQLAVIGFLLKQDDWLASGRQAADGLLAQPHDWANDWEAKSARDRYVNLMLHLNEGERAEALILEAMKQTVMQQAQMPDQDLFTESNDMREHLVELADLYHRLNRHEDVLTLCKKAPYWGCVDLKAIYLDSADYDSVLAPKTSQPMGYIVAYALAESERIDEANRILEAVIIAEGGFDPAYELYIRLNGVKALPFLDKLATADQFEERPLIWKGHLLRTNGKLDEAEAALKAAQAIDPSDGEQGRGFRMRVYKELAELNRQRGDQKQAAFFDGVMRAIRMAEDADRVYDIGLLRRGIAMYQESLTHFADAYCIQSRLAVQLEEAGSYKLAEAHYQKAFELMPDSFGRLESHCFGCEGVFSSDLGKSIAERTFAKLREKMPKKPQVHYMLGYLRSQQGRYQDAAALFHTAVELDPDYLSAWKKLQATACHIHRPVAEHERTALAILRLDPRGKHAIANLQNVISLPTLWRACANAQMAQLPPPPNMLKFPASKASNDADHEALVQAMIYDNFNHGAFIDETMMYELMTDQGNIASSYEPGTAVSRHVVVSLVIHLWRSQLWNDSFGMW